MSRQSKAMAPLKVRNELCVELKGLAASLISNTKSSEQLTWENQKQFLADIKNHVSKYLTLTKDTASQFSYQGIDRLKDLLLKNQQQLESMLGSDKANDEDTQVIVCLITVSACLNNILKVYYRDQSSADTNYLSTPIDEKTRNATIHNLIEMIDTLNKPLPHEIDNSLPHEINLLNFISKLKQEKFHENDIEDFKKFAQTYFFETGKLPTTRNEDTKIEIANAWGSVKKKFYLADPELTIKSILQKMVSLYLGKTNELMTEEQLDAIKIPSKPARNNTPSTTCSPTASSDSDRLSKSNSPHASSTSKRSSSFFTERAEFSSSSPTNSTKTRISIPPKNKSLAKKATSTVASTGPETNTVLTEKEKNDIIKKLKAYYNPDSFFSFHPTISSDRKKCVKDLIIEINACKNKNELLEKILIAQSTIAEDDYRSDFGKPSNQIVAPAPWHHFTIKPRNVTGSRLTNLLNGIVESDIIPNSSITAGFHDLREHIQHLLNVISYRSFDLVDKGKIRSDDSFPLITLDVNGENLNEIHETLKKHIVTLSKKGTFRYETSLLNLMKTTDELICKLGDKLEAEKGTQSSVTPGITSTLTHSS